MANEQITEPRCPRCKNNLFAQWTAGSFEDQGGDTVDTFMDAAGRPKVRFIESTITKLIFCPFCRSTYTYNHDTQVFNAVN